MQLGIVEPTDLDTQKSLDPYCLLANLETRNSLDILSGYAGVVDPYSVVVLSF